MNDKIDDSSVRLNEHDCAHFKKSDLPLAFAQGFHDIRKTVIEQRVAAGDGGQSAQLVSKCDSNGGNRSAVSTQDFGKEWTILADS